jgi:hypothetical protein
MTPRASVGAVLASALRKVVGNHLSRSGLGHVWKDDFTWLELAREIDAALRGHLVLVDKKIYDELVADANQMRYARKCIEEYKARLPPDKKKDGVKNPYVRWALEHMPPKEGT